MSWICSKRYNPELGQLANPIVCYAAANNLIRSDTILVPTVVLPGMMIRLQRAWGISRASLEASLGPVVNLSAKTTAALTQNKLTRHNHAVLKLELNHANLPLIFWWLTKDGCMTRHMLQVYWLGSFPKYLKYFFYCLCKCCESLFLFIKSSRLMDCIGE